MATVLRAQCVSSVPLTKQGHSKGLLLLQQVLLPFLVLGIVWAGGRDPARARRSPA